PEARAGVSLSLNQSRESELGRFTLDGSSRFSTGPHSAGGGRSVGPYAMGMSRGVFAPENAVANARLAHDSALQQLVTVSDFGLSARSKAPASRTSLSDQSTIHNPKSKITSADLLEALHAATGMPIVADFYTRLYQPEAVSVKNQPLFSAL